MARVLRGTLTLCVAFGLTSIALGQQQQPQPRQQPPPPSVLGPTLSDPNVQKELKLSDDQISKLKDALGKVMDKYKDDIANFQRMSPSEQQKKIEEIRDGGKKAVAGILDAKQRKRYQQIEWQNAGIGALSDPDLQKELKLSDEQKKKLAGIFSEAQKKAREMSQKPPATREEAQTRYEAFRKDLETKTNDVLNDEQKKNLKEMMGPPFKRERPGTGR